MRERPVWRGVAILLASFLGHVICFFLLQVSYPPTISKPPVPARIYLPIPGSEEAKLVAAWAEVADPSRGMISPEPATMTVSSRRGSLVTTAVIAVESSACWASAK